MKNYTVIEADNIEELIGLVNEKTYRGWKPCGGICVTTDWSHGGISIEKFYQAICME